MEQRTRKYDTRGESYTSCSSSQKELCIYTQFQLFRKEQLMQITSNLFTDTQA